MIHIKENATRNVRTENHNRSLKCSVRKKKNDFYKCRISEVLSIIVTQKIIPSKFEKSCQRISNEIYCNKTVQLIKWEATVTLKLKILAIIKQIIEFSNIPMENDLDAE